MPQPNPQYANGYTPKKVLYFIAGTSPTAAEAADIAYLNARPWYSCNVRSVLKNSAFSSPEDLSTASIETADLAACQGSIIPSAYSGVPVLTIQQGGTGLQLVIGPAALSFLHTSVSHMTAVTIDGLGNVVDVTADPGMVWTSGTPANMTIGAGTGVLTGVLAGTSLITATLTKSAKTVVATQTVTCT